MYRFGRVAIFIKRGESLFREMVVSVLTISGVRHALLSSIVILARLKADSDDIVETSTINISLANM